MKFRKLSIVLTEEQEKNLNKLDWFMVVADKEIEKVRSFFERLELLDNQKQKIHKEYKELLLFKINQIYHLIMSLVKNIYDSSFYYYQQHFGIYKNKNRFLEMKEMTISYQFESFLTQLKSLIDFFIKYIWEIKLENKIKKMDSFEYITRKIEILSLKKYKTQEYKRAKKKIEFLKKEKVLDKFFKNFEAFYNLKNYRDFIIHRGRIKQDKMVSQADRYIQYNYYIPELKLTNKEYKINNKHQHRLDFFCRLRYIELIHIIWGTLDKLIESKDLDKSKNEIKAINKNDVREVLRYLGRKLIWNDKSFMKKEDVENFLETQGLKFSDLIIEKEIKERQMDGIKSVKGEDMSYLLERTIYKPIKGLRFQKIKHNYDRYWKPKRDEDRYGFTKSYFTLDDIKSPKENVEKILESFVKLGIIIKIKDSEGIKYEFIDEELHQYIATLLHLSQYKWSFIQYPQMKYFRKPKIKERIWLKNLYKEKFDEQMEKDDKDRKNLWLEYEKYKKKQKEWINFKRKHSLDVKTFKKNQLNYKSISQNWKAGLYEKIRKNWDKEYNDEGQIDVWNKEKTQITDCIQLLDYLHELNTNFKSWKKNFKGKKFDEIKKLAKRVFHNKKEHWLDIQKKWLKKDQSGYIKRLKKGKERFSKIKRKYVYLNKALRLINGDFFVSKINL